MVESSRRVWIHVCILVITQTTTVPIIIIILLIAATVPHPQPILMHRAPPVFTLPIRQTSNVVWVAVVVIHGVDPVVAATNVVDLVERLLVVVVGHFRGSATHRYRVASAPFIHDAAHVTDWSFASFAH